MSGTRRIFLVRHAPVAGPAGVIHGPGAPADVSDSRLVAATRGALAQAASAASWCSPALRTRQTAAALGLAPAIDRRIAEQDFGAWTGCRHADLAAEPGDAYALFWRDAAGNAPPGGESFRQQITRVADFLAALAAGDHIVVTHSGVIRAAVAVALDMQPEKALGLVIEPLSMTLLEHTPGGWRVGWVNRLAGWPGPAEHG
ncbi:histidine phosphatase family protein [Camelimonas lactis]|uniref:Alpha-ribazole phosphatase n=1 Tax=Camelimonas lactis TaxID=659006 RepID=A0A4V2RXF3_9HYPH|nr:histidine phosphatase family protein [Camelimonas lactis]TCO13460.1 alpha-ribazole phosphatase [Camelimonas lactis]